VTNSKPDTISVRICIKYIVKYSSKISFAHIKTRRLTKAERAPPKISKLAQFLLSHQKCQWSRTFKEWVLQFQASAMSSCWENFDESLVTDKWTHRHMDRHTRVKQYTPSPSGLGCRVEPQWGNCFYMCLYREHI
jgi:hypothetical protein